jgi:mono/diheme cytochrome c family protein
MVFPEAVLQAKPVPGSDHLIVASFTPHNSPPRGSIAMIDTQKGKNDPQAIYNFEHPDKPLFDRGDSCDPTALDSNTVLYSGIPDDPGAPTIPVGTKPFRKRNTPKLNALMLIDRTGNKRVICSDPAIDLHDPIPVQPRPLPPIVSDTTNRSKITGNFFVQNVYANMPQVPKGSIKYLRVIEETSRVSESPGGTWMNQTFSISAALAWSPKIFHGIVPVEEDGSVYFEAPSGRALYFQLLDKDYKLVRSMRTFIQAVPGTTRSCIGCHEYDSAPRSASPAFTGKQPKQLTDESWGSGYIDYASMIQPILDKKCVSCHGGEKALAGGLDLTGGQTEYFCNSYESLTARREKQYIADLIAGVCCMNGTADYSCRIFEPYQQGSGKAPLAEILLKEPHLGAAGLTKQEKELILAWIDTNGLYFGTWDYTSCSKPAIKEYAPLRAALINVMKKNQCATCHTNGKGEVARFDNWINLERPELSIILRAPLAASETAKDGFGLGLCRDRKVDSNFSRRGTLFKAGYAHQVLPLDKFPSQKWQNWQEVHAGEPMITFASTNDTVYQEMLALITAAGQRQRATPRIDMPGAGKFAVPGRSRQIIPQPLPETMPPLFAERTSEKNVRLSWECSCRTIGLITEIHRSDKPDFKPASATLIGKTERFEFFDEDVPNGDVYYAMVFVSDPAATCGTCKSGATLDYNHSMVDTVPTVRRIEDRCPLSMVEPMRSEPSRTVRAE